MKFIKPIFGSLILVLLILVLSNDPNIKLPVIEYGVITENQSQILLKSEVLVSEANLDSVQTINDSIIFVGDVMLARNVELLMRKNNSKYPYEGINFNEFTEKSFIVGNFEASIPLVHVPTKIFTMNFSVDKTLLPFAFDAGFTHFSLANNHSLDYGIDNYLNTRKQLQTKGFQVFGEPSQLSNDSVNIINLNNSTVSLIGINTLSQKPSVLDIENILTYATQNSDFQIIYAHWGTEYDLKSNSSQREFAKQLVEAGADLVIGHHPHVVQEVELIDGVPVFYSLGNYIFDQYFSTDVQQGLMLNIDFEKSNSIQLIPVTSEGSLSQPNIMNDKASKHFLLNLSQRSDDELALYIKAGTIPLGKSFATSSKMAIMNR